MREAILLLCGILLAAASAAVTMEDSQQRTAKLEPLKPCQSPEFRQFDFWLGDWYVESAASPGSVSRNQGGPLYLDGALQCKAMILSTTTDSQSVNRITWTPLDDGRVRQLTCKSVIVKLDHSDID